MLLNEKDSGWSLPQSLSGVQDELLPRLPKVDLLSKAALAIRAIVDTLSSSQPHLEAVIGIDEASVKRYCLTGQLTEKTASRCLELFDYAHDPEQVVINFSHASIRDRAGANAVVAAIKKYHQVGKPVAIVGLNAESYAWAREVGVIQHLLSPVASLA